MLRFCLYHYAQLVAITSPIIFKQIRNSKCNDLKKRFDFPLSLPEPKLG